MTNTNETLEKQVIELVAADRFDIPVSSLSGKLKRMKPKLAEAIEVPSNYFQGQRVYARIESEDCMKARGMREGIAEFSKAYPKHGEILNGYIEGERIEKETHLYFGMQPGCRLTADDYLGVMSSLKFTDAQARALYGTLIDVSRDIASKRQEKERSIMIGGNDAD
jgi:hypothetical protein